jgi:DNA invertase Pin-like site-specific DNA recombinase
MTPRATRQTARTRRAAARRAVAKRCVIYLRVSTDEQVSSGLGLDAQEASCRRWAEANGLTVVDVVTEQAVSGKVAPADRPGFGRALALLDGCEAGVLLVRRQDRISRRLRHTLAVIDHADEQGWSIATTDGELDTSTAAGRLKVNVMASVAEYEAGVIGERTREALAAKREAGVLLGRRRQMPDDVVARIVAEREAGRTLTAVAQGLNDDGIPTARGGGVWWQSTVSAALARHHEEQAAAARRAAAV